MPQVYRDTCGDFYATAQLTLLGYTAAGATTVVATPTPVTGAGCFQVTNSNTQTPYPLPTATHHADLTWRAHIRKSEAASQLMVRFYGDANATTHITFQVQLDGSIKAFRGTESGTLLGQTATGLVPVAAWTHVELRAKLSDTVGEITIWVNGVSALSLTAQDTKNAGTLLVFSGFGWNSFNTSFIDNIVVDTNSAGAQLGEVKVAALPVTGAGAVTGFTPSAGLNYQAVDDATPNTSDWVASDVVDTIDTYAITDLPANTLAVKSVTLLDYAQKSDAGARSHALLVRHSGTNYAGADQALGTSYAHYRETWETNPGTAAAWTPANVNALEIGVKARA